MRSERRRLKTKYLFVAGGFSSCVSFVFYRLIIPHERERIKFPCVRIWRGSRFFTKSTPQKCYDKRIEGCAPPIYGAQRQGGKKFVEYDSSDDTGNNMDQVCSYTAYLRPLLRHGTQVCFFDARKRMPRPLVRAGSNVSRPLMQAG